MVHWMKIKHLIYDKDSPHLIKFRYDFDENLKALCVCASGRKKGKGVHLESRYNLPLKINAAERADLINLCDTHVISDVYHSYYRSLPFAEKSSSTEEEKGESSISNRRIESNANTLCFLPSQFPTRSGPKF